MELTKEFELIYHPYRRNLGAVPLGIAGALAGFFGLWALYFHGDQAALPAGEKLGLTVLWSAVLILSLLFIRWMAVSSRQTLRITKKGIALLNDGDDAVCFFTWKSVPHTTKTRNLLRRKYLVVSGDPMPRGKAALLTNRVALTMKIRSRDRFVIWNNRTEIADQVYEYITGRGQDEDE